MNRWTRRDWLQACGAAGVLSVPRLGRAADERPWRIATWNVDATPRLGHPLLGSLFAPARAVDEPLTARGFVLQGPEPAIVVASIDWCELRNDAFTRWREALADAAGTTVERVLIHSVHQHDAPYFDLEAQRLIAASEPGGLFCDLEFHEQVVTRATAAVRKLRDTGTIVTHVGCGAAKIDGLASNRRVEIDGRVAFNRSSRTVDPRLQAADDGEIDPWLKGLSFWNGDRPLAALNVYACHPMSTYGQHRISIDFVGLARDRRQRDDADCFQIYASGCCGDVTAGKYNDGSPGTRERLADRLYRAMAEAAERTERFPLRGIDVRQGTMLLPHAEEDESVLRARLDDGQVPLARRVYAAMSLSNRRRNPAGHAIDVQTLDFGPAQLVLLPAESFVGYQLAAQAMRPDQFIVALGFGECAPGYLPTDRAFREGFQQAHGYVWVRPGAEGIYLDTVKQVLKSPRA